MLQDLVGRIPTDKLQNYRRERYQSVEQAIPLAQFPPAYRTALPALYRDLQALATLLEGPRQERHVSLDDAARKISDFSRFARELATLDLDEQLARAVHDIRGGALSALSLELQNLASESSHVTRGTPQAQELMILTRDQRKIMRNLVADIDEAAAK